MQLLMYQGILSFHIITELRIFMKNSLQTEIIHTGKIMGIIKELNLQFRLKKIYLNIDISH